MLQEISIAFEHSVERFKRARSAFLTVQSTSYKGGSLHERKASGFAETDAPKATGGAGKSEIARGKI